MMCYIQPKNHRPQHKTHTGFTNSLDGPFCRVALSTSTPNSRIKKPCHGVNEDCKPSPSVITSQAGKAETSQVRRGNGSKRAFGEMCLWA